MPAVAIGNHFFMSNEEKSVFHGLATIPVGLIVLVAFLLGTAYGPQIRTRLNLNKDKDKNAAEAVVATVPASAIADLAEAVLPSAGVTLPVTWGDLGKQMIEKGVIDRDKFVSLYEDRLGFGAEEKTLLEQSGNGSIRINPDNAGFLLNLLWALGLGNKNSILDSGPMVDERYGGAGNFASTGGWSLSKGNAMDHYSRHEFIKLAKDEQAKVERVAQNIYRPCCDNSTFFPDCNHGMAMLALLELMAAQGVSEKEMYAVALQVNAYWFPDTYMTLAKFEAGNGNSWPNADPKKLLGAEFSSASGYRAIRSQVEPVQQGGGGGCGV